MPRYALLDFHRPVEAQHEVERGLAIEPIECGAADDRGMRWPLRKVIPCPRGRRWHGSEPGSRRER